MNGFDFCFLIFDILSNSIIIYDLIQFSQVLLRKKAAEELKRQQEAKAAERRKVIAERTGPKKSLDELDEGEFKIDIVPLPTLSIFETNLLYPLII